MKIAILTNSFSSNGGVGNYVTRLARAFGKQGEKVVIVHSDPHPESLEDKNLTQYCIPGYENFEPPDSSQKTRAVLSVLAQEKPDIVHVQASMHYALESEIRRIYPSVKSMHVYEFCPSGSKYHHASGKICRHSTGIMCAARMIYKRCTTSWRPSTMGLFYRRSMRGMENDSHYSKLIVASRYVRQEALASGYSSSQVEVIPYFVDLQSHQGQGKPTGSDILFSGRVVPEKGLDKLLEALSLIRDKEWTLSVAGDGSALNQMKNLTQKLDLENRVRFPGWISQKEQQKLYQQAAVVVVPSLWPEPFGIVGIEAMSHGKPVVAFDVGGISDWLEDGKTGFLIESRNVPAMADRISELLVNQELAGRMGSAGRDRAGSLFNEQNHLEKIKAIYQEINPSCKVSGGVANECE